MKTNFHHHSTLFRCSLFLLWLFSFPLQAQQNCSVTASISYENVTNPSFENTPVGWAFGNIAGVADNSNPALNGNPDTPFGNKLMYMRGASSAAQFVTTTSDGCFRIKLWGAQYANNVADQTAYIFINGIEMAQFTPVDINYNPYYSVAFTLPAGTHSLILATDVGSDIVLLDNVEFERLPCWSDPNTWSCNTGTTPGTSATVQVPMDKVVVLDEDAMVTEITINGQFLAANNLPLELNAERIMVMGGSALWEWGHENTPYEKRGLITLRGDISQVNVHPDMGSGFIGAMMGAQLRMHGNPKDSWTMLSKHAEQGATGITLEKAMNWEKGDTIVIASTDFDCHQAEKRMIESINGNVVTFADPLLYEHFGELQSYDNGNYMLDERAEVGLLNRNLKIQGDADAEVDGFGGHVMVMMGSKSNISNVEFFRMGQRGELGRYPFHWHLTGDLTGQYIKDCSIHKSFNRVLTVHTSNNGLIENNVAYNHIGNGYFLENGDEINNRFIRNLGILTLKPHPDSLVRPYDLLPAANPAIPYFRLPATFWITHPTNDFIGNACGGSEGSGFWMVTLTKPIEDDPGGIVPYTSPLGVFDDNRSHSTSFSNYSIDLTINADHTVNETTFLNYSPPSFPVTTVNRFTSFKCRDRAIWMRTQTLHFRDCHSANNGRSTFFSFNNHIYNSLYVGKSANVGTPSEWAANESATGRSLPIPDTSLTAHPVENHFRAHPLYDGPSEIYDCHFADFFGSDASIFSPNTAFAKGTVHRVSGMTFENVPRANKFAQLFSKDRDFQWTTGLIDIDGSVDDLTSPGDHIKPEIIAPDKAYQRVYDNGFNREPGATYVPEWEHFICPDEHYGLLMIHHSYSSSRKTPMYCYRSDGPGTFTIGQDYKQQIPVMPNTDYRYYLQVHRLARSIDLDFRFLSQFDTAVFIFPNMPSEIIVQSATQMNSLADFNNGTGQQYYFENNTLYLRLRATQTHNTKVLGTNYIYETSVRICEASGSCGQEFEGGSFGMPLADYERGLDTRATLNIWGDLTNSGITPSPNPGPGGADDYNSFTVSTDADDLDEYVDYRLDFDRQIWTEFNNIKIDYTGPKVQVLLNDASEGEVHLGYYQDGSCYGLDLTRLLKEEKDEVNALILRVYESYVDPNWKTSVQQATLELRRLYLDYSLEYCGFHFDDQQWGPILNTTIEHQSDGTLKLTPNSNAFGIRMDLFFGLPPIDVTQVPKVVVRMKNTGNTGINTQFGKFEWGGNWVHTTMGLNNNTDYNNYLYDMNFASNDDMQRIRLVPFTGGANGGESVVDYVRLTTCETCYDEIQNGQETGIDCGGPECLPCTCEDGILNGDEVEVDCGGSCPKACSNLVFEDGVIDNLGSNWTVVNTQNSYQNMVIVATPILANPGQTPVVTRIQNITSNSFEIRLQKAGGGTIQLRDVHYFVVEEGVYNEVDDGINMEAVRADAALTAYNTSWFLESRTYQNSYTNPVVLGQVQSYNDPEWSVFWASADNNRANPPSATNFAAGKHVGEDPSNARATEQIGYIVGEAGVYVFGNDILEFGLGADIVQGSGDALLTGGHQYGTDNDLRVRTAVLSSAAMDGINGGWPVLYGTTPVFNNRIRMVIDEDVLLDIERNHTQEQVAYLAIGEHSASLNGGGQGASSQLAGTTPDEIENNTRQFGTVKVFPNPTAPGQIIQLQDVNASLDRSISLYTLDGSQVAFELIQYSPEEIKLRTPLQAGVYLLRYRAAGELHHQRIIVLDTNTK